MNSCQTFVYALENGDRMKALFSGVTLKVFPERIQIVTESLKLNSACDISTIKEKPVWLEL